MTRFMASLFLLGLLILPAPLVAAQLSTTAKQWEKGEDLYVQSWTYARSFAHCASPHERKRGNKIVISTICRELDAVPGGRTVKLKGKLRHWNGDRWRTIRDCEDVVKTRGFPGRLDLECSFKLPRWTR